jgi:hypothetical protein
MNIIYGTINSDSNSNSNIDVTEICYKNLLRDDFITIPSGDDVRSGLFTDPQVGVLKKIFIINGANIFVGESTATIRINVIDNTIHLFDNKDIDDKLEIIHSKLKINHGDFNEEYPEQRMAVRYLTGNEKVLEIGGNIGRNSLVIAYLLAEKGNNNLVTLESNEDIAVQLIENKTLNNYDFYIENSALSKRKLIQKGWDAIESDTLIDGFKNVNIITFEELQSKYNIIFDTLVLDCEGAFYSILMDMPEMLKNINLIIMENDYFQIEKKNYVDDVLKANGFYIDYVESGGWGPCTNNFFEVWKRRKTLNKNR